MLASGEIVHITRESDLYRAACVSLGSLGVILRLTFQCEPAFRLHQSQHPAKLSDVSKEKPEEKSYSIVRIGLRTRSARETMCDAKLSNGRFGTSHGGLLGPKRPPNRNFS